MERRYQGKKQRKKSASFRLTRRTLLNTVSVMILIVVICAGTTAISVFQTSRYAAQADTQKQRSDVQGALLVSDTRGSLPQIQEDNNIAEQDLNRKAGLAAAIQNPADPIEAGEIPVVSPEEVALPTPIPSAVTEVAPVRTAEPTPINTADGTPLSIAEPTPIDTADGTPLSIADNTPIDTADGTPLSIADNTPIDTADGTPLSIADNTPIDTADGTPLSATETAPLSTAEEIQPSTTDVATLNTVAPGKSINDLSYENGTSNEILENLPMREAVAQISTAFQANIDAQIAAMEANEKFDEVRIIYEGDMDGDSETVNNWADVLSVYIAETMDDEQKLLTILPQNISLLSDIYDEMNSFSIRSSKTYEIMTNESLEGETRTTTLTIYITVNSLTYKEAAELNYFDSAQTKKLEELMSPDYYTYFEELLGIDVYDGNSKDIEAIIARLPAGSKSEIIVESALIRLGNSYSQSKRGTDNYVDCSYFVWWAYNQAGISIPMTSVKQAIYCYDKDYTIHRSDLIPGDLVFWSKTICNCGRWHEIHHVAIYIGENKVIEASSCMGRVAIRKLWGLDKEDIWQVYMYARPYTEEKTS